MADSCGSSCSSAKASGCGTTREAQDAALAQQENAITRSLGKIKNKILVMSGKGGVGKSTVSVNLALGLAQRGHMVGLMDVDIHGPDVIRMLNLKGTLEPPATAGGLVPPLRYNDNLKVVSLEYMLKDRDQAIIWRGPLKIQAIRQFVADMDWGELDYLIIDAPPGTGDEPLTICQLIPEMSGAVVVTTGQAVALLDSRKAINFLKTVGIPVLGVLENMTAFCCPHCAKEINLFKTGGGAQAAAEMGVPFLGSVPFDPAMVDAGDEGRFYAVEKPGSPPSAAIRAALDKVLEAVKK